MFIENLTVGADPELFVKAGRHFLSGHLFECGTKAEPMKTKHAYIQNDGIALEINIKPARSRDEFVTNCNNALSDLRSFINRTNDKAELVARPSIFFGRKRLQALPPMAKILGCTPDYVAGSEEPNFPPDSDAPFRTGAGHIHIGWTEDADTSTGGDHFKLCTKIVQEMDYFVGLPSMLWDKDARRRTLYGKAGTFRVKPYGLEYRTLSNAWLRNNNLMGFVYQQTVRCMHSAQSGRSLFHYWGYTAANYINGNDLSWTTKKSLVQELEK